MVVSSNGALGTLQELGGLATSRLQGLLGNGSGLAELLGTSKIVSSPQVKALVQIGNVVADRVMERAMTGKELQALKDIGNVLLARTLAAVQGLAEQVNSGVTPGLQARFQELSGLAVDVVKSTGLSDGLARLAETAMGAIAKSRP
jgi:hypothetical protein